MPTDCIDLFADVVEAMINGPQRFITSLWNRAEGARAAMDESKFMPNGDETFDQFSKRVRETKITPVDVERIKKEIASLWSTGGPLEDEDDGEFDYVDIDYFINTENGVGSIQVALDMPGVPQNKLVVELNDHVLKINGTRSDERGEYDEYIDLDSHYALDFDETVATLRDGVLTIVVPTTGFANVGRRINIHDANATPESKISIGN